jgi:hypothetical protein
MRSSPDGSAHIFCCGCGVRSPSNAAASEAAVAWWNKRRGTVSTLGGLATRGLSSRKKRIASRRNLRKARRVKLGLLAVERVEISFLLSDLHRALQRGDQSDLSDRLIDELRSLEPRMVARHRNLLPTFKKLREQWAALRRRNLHDRH